MNATIVTAYYKIPSKFSDEKYMMWIKNFLEEISCNLYIFTDSSSYEKLKEMRKKFNNTVIIQKDFKDLKMAQMYDIWISEYSKDHEKHHTPELYIIWNEKTNFIMESMKDNKFNSEYFFWCDIGAFRDPNMIQRLKKFPNPEKISSLKKDKVYILEIEPLTDEKMIKGQEIPQFDFKYTCSVGGGIFGGHKRALIEWNDKFYNMLSLFLKNGRFAGKDQNIMVSVYVMNHELIELVKSKDYGGDKWFYMEYFLS